LLAELWPSARKAWTTGTKISGQTDPRFGQDRPAEIACLSQIRGLPKAAPAAFFAARAAFVRFGDHASLFLSQSRIKMQHERDRAPLGLARHDEWHPLRHQAGYKGNVARQAVELGNNYAALRSLCYTLNE